MHIDLTGKTAIITGSTAGIGYAIAEGLARAGAHVVINGRNQDKLTQAADRIRAAVPNAEIVQVTADVATADGAAAMIEAVPSADILINNLGIYAFKEFAEFADDEWLHFFQTNVMSGVRLTRHYLPTMKDNGWGRIVFVSSESALQVPTDMIPYAMTKTAQLTIARGLAQSTAGTGVTVNTVLPGPTMTETLFATFAEQAEKSATSTEEVAAAFIREERPDSLIQRFLKPDEVANMTVYICSEQASGTSGAPLRVEGGLLKSIA